MSRRFIRRRRESRARLGASDPATSRTEAALRAIERPGGEGPRQESGRIAEAQTLSTKGRQQGQGKVTMSRQTSETSAPFSPKGSSGSRRCSLGGSDTSPAPSPKFSPPPHSPFPGRLSPRAGHVQSRQRCEWDRTTYVPPRPGLSWEQPGLPWEGASTRSDTPNAEPGPRSNLRSERALGGSSETRAVSMTKRMCLCVFLSITMTPRRQSPALLLRFHVTSVSDMGEVIAAASPRSPRVPSLTHHTPSLRTSDDVLSPQRKGDDGEIGFVREKEPR